MAHKCGPKSTSLAGSLPLTVTSHAGNHYAYPPVVAHLSNPGSK